MFIHELSDVQSSTIGTDTKIWQFVVVLKNAIIGRNCNICANSFIENDVIIGNDVTIKSGVYIWDGVIIDDGVFVGPCVAFTNDKYPRSKHYTDNLIKTRVERNASIGANSTILPGVTIGENSLVGAGSVVTKDVPPNTIVIGNPAKIVRILESK